MKTTLEWFDARETQPIKYGTHGFLCRTIGTSQGDDAPGYRLLFYDIKKKQWCKNPPDYCIKGQEEYLEWRAVTHWAEIIPIILKQEGEQ